MSHATSAQPSSTKLLTQTLESIFRTHLVRCLVETLSLHGGSLSHCCTASVTYALSELVLTSSKFMKQFVDSNGIGALRDLGVYAGQMTSSLHAISPRHGHGREQTGAQGKEKEKEKDKPLRPTGSTGASDPLEQENCAVETIVNALQIASHLARHSEEHYTLLAPLFPARNLCWVLSHADPTVRAKSCNFVGNLCRHSDYFYSIDLVAVDTSSK